MSVRGRGAVITGGGRGIGAAIARVLAEQGCKVLVASRTGEQIEEVSTALRRDGYDAWAKLTDVSDPKSVKAMFRKARKELGTVDILVNSAGRGHSAPIKSTTLDDWNAVMAVNATGTFLCTKEALKWMCEQGWGRVINIASTAAKTGGPYISAYSASKHAVLGFSRCAALECADSGVTVNAVCPGYVDTEMTRSTLARIVEKTGMDEEMARQTLMATSPQKRLIKPFEVASLVLWLCSDGADGITGQAIVQDGGGVQG